MNKLLIHPGEGVFVSNPDREVVLEKIGFGVCLIVIRTSDWSKALCHIVFHSSARISSTSKINPMSYADTALNALIGEINRNKPVPPNESEGDNHQEFEAILIGGCRPMIGTSLKKLHESELDIGPRIIVALKSQLKDRSAKLRYQHTEGSNLRSIRIRENRISSYEETFLNREPRQTDLSMKDGKWILTQDNEHQILK